MKSPADEHDIEDFDSVEEYIGACMDTGYTIEAADFEGRPCAFCGELIDFARVMRDPDVDVPTHDIEVGDPETGENEPYVDRHYFCSEDCRDEATGSVEWFFNGQTEHVEPDRIHVDDLEGNT